MKTKGRRIWLFLAATLMVMMFAGVSVSAEKINTNQLYYMTPGETSEDNHWVEFTLKKPAKVMLTISGIEFGYGSYDEYGEIKAFLNAKSTNDVGTAVIDYDWGWRTKDYYEVVLKKGTHRVLLHTDWRIDAYNFGVWIREEYTEGPVTAITMPKTKTVTKGMKVNLNPQPVKIYEKLTGLKWKSSKKSVATVDSKGVVTAKKKGKATITCTLKNGKQYKCTVTVKDNVYTGRAYSKCKVGNYDYGQVWLEPLKISYSGKKLKVQCAALNNRMFKAKKFKWITLTVYDGNSKVIAKHKFKNKSLNIKPYGKKKITFTFPSSKVKNKKYDLRVDKYMYIVYEYYYTYQY